MSEASRKWRCPYCDGLNDWQNQVCEICGDGLRNEAEPATRAEKPVEMPKTYTPPRRESEEIKPAPLPTAPEKRDAASDAGAGPLAPAAEAARKGGHAAFWTAFFAAACAALTWFDGLLAWLVICTPLGLVGTALCPPSDTSSYGYLCALFLGLIPIAALWLRSRGSKFLAFLFATAGLACAAAAVYAMLTIHVIYALGWLIYALAALLAWIYAVAGRHGRGFGGFCLFLGIVSLGVTAWLTLHTDWIRTTGNAYASIHVPRSLTNVGTTWWNITEWASFIFGSHKLLSGGPGPASAWLPFSRALAILAMGFGLRLPARSE